MPLSVWLDPVPAPRPALSGDVACDVVVIGAGVTGAAAARHLARAGVEVVWLESSRVAMRATGRNAGFILQGTAERYDRARTMMGADRARRVHAWSLDNHDRMAAVIADEGIACHYRRGGSLQLAGSAQEEAELVESARLLRADGFEAELLTGDAVPAVHRAAGFGVGVRLPRDGELDPAAFVRGAADAATRAGARLFEDSPVIALHADAPGDVRAVTPGGVVSAQVALVCTNARAGQLLPWFADKVDPVRGQMLATAPAPPLFDQPIYADHGYDYWRQDHLGRVVLGGWRNLDPDAEVGHEETLNEGIQARMTAFLRRYPGMADVPVTHRWAGIMGFSRDGLPLVGPAPSAPGAVVAAGFTGHGFGFAWLSGEAAATVVLDGSHPLVDDLGPRRFA